MSTEVETRIEGPRGCGYRKGGGIYLMSGGVSAPCGRLPIPLSICPTCKHGIKPARGWTWIDLDALIKDRPCEFGNECAACPMGTSLVAHEVIDFSSVGLVWIGERYYPTPADWVKEAKAMGASRRIPAVPNGFVLGETWVAVAHRKVIPSTCETCEGSKTALEDSPRQGSGPGSGPVLAPCPDCDGTGSVLTPAIFHLFRPDAIEYVVKGDETDEQLEAMRKRGITPIKVVRDIDNVLLVEARDVPVDPDYEVEDADQVDDGPKTCPECDRANQFGELCDACRRAQQLELEGGDQDGPDNQPR